MKGFAAGLATVVATVALAEIGAWVAVRSGWLESPPPRYGETGFWRGHHPEFGVWHEADATTVHATRCFTAEYRTNSVGARDIERELESGQPRVVVLGDSFLEGWGLTASNRMSNLLERDTGLPHLNFAMAHFSPYQQLIVYRQLASRFEHDAVIASLTPANDFLDMDLARANEMSRYEYRYRPYLIGEPPDFQHFDHREPSWRRGLRGYSYLFNALLQAARSMRDAEDPAPATNPGRPKSQFYDFNERDLARLEAVLEGLAEATVDRRTAFVLVPTERDLERRAIAGPDPLSRRLAPIVDRLDVQLVNLLPTMAEHSADWNSYFLGCDYHWSRLANRVAATRVRRELASFYSD